MPNPASLFSPGVEQTVSCGRVQQRRFSPADTMFVNTGRRLYVIGDIDGGFRPRSNPYDLYSFGRPDPEDPLANKLQGVWAQPVKALDSYTWSVEGAGSHWELVDARQFRQTFVSAEFEYRRGDLAATRRDFAAQDRPLLFSTLTVHNRGSTALDLRLAFTVVFDLEDAWFTSFADRRNTGEVVTAAAGRLVATAEVAPQAWAVAVGCQPPPDETRLVAGQPSGQFFYARRLEPGREFSWTVAIVVELEGGSPAALAHVNEWLPQCATLYAAKQAVYESLLETGPSFHSSDPAIDAAFDLARANLQLLEAESAALGRYFYAGLENFPFWFSCDGAYGVPGMLAAGLTAPGLNTVRIGAQFQEAGCVPHQLSPSGQRAFPGNAGETPLWVLSVWDAYRWSGDRSFVDALYPAAVHGLFDYMLGTLNPDGDNYPIGPGLVERDDMGAKKIDSAAYLWAGLRALESLAAVMQDEATARRARQEADRLAEHFEPDWWSDSQASYVMSLEIASNVQRPLPHWAVVTPLEVGLARPDQARTMLATLCREYLNEWGLKHTVGDDERVWTLPTAALSRAAYRYADPALGFQMLKQLSQTLEHGSIGMFHELIPDGMCFVQLWSAACFVRGLVEDLLGIEVRADQRALTVAPQLPMGWDFAELENLSFGEQTVTIRAAADLVTVTYLRGSGPLQVRLQVPGADSRTEVLQPGAGLEVRSGSRQP